MSRGHENLTISQEEAATIPDECLVHGGILYVQTDAEIEGERYLSGRAYCKRAPLLESQKKFEECPAAKTCVLHKFESRIEVKIKPDADKEEELKKQKEEIIRKKISAAAFVM